jgi:hypothetical protein
MSILSGGHIEDVDGIIHNPDRICWVWAQKEIEEDEENDELIYPGYYLMDIDGETHELTERGFEAAMEVLRVRGT